MNKKNAIDNEKIEDYIKKNLHAKEIAKLLGVSRQAVYDKAKILGYKRFNRPEWVKEEMD